MADLWDRLRAAQTRVPATPPPPQAPEVEPPPPGWTWETPLVARRTLAFSLDPGFWRAIGTGLDPADWDRVLCFDTETTGLSGGAGTLAFLVGWAVLVPGPGPVPRVEVSQWFLRDHPGEPDLIRLLDQEISAARGLVSFNGASFDLPLMRSRWALAGRPFVDLPHRDDLHPSRRLWKRLWESCRLGTLEGAVLGIERVDDVPGSLVPELWFRYLREGAEANFMPTLEGVIRHHAQDVYSLLCLDLLLAALARTPRHPRWLPTLVPVSRRPPIARPAEGGLLHPDLGPATAVDFWGLLALKNPEEAELSLEETWAGGDEAVGLAWADRLKRRLDPAAREVWTNLWETKKSYPALEELLKWLEHREKTPEARAEALALVGEGLSAPFLPSAWRLSLEKRRERLRRKVRPSEGG